MRLVDGNQSKGTVVEQKTLRRMRDIPYFRGPRRFPVQGPGLRTSLDRGLSHDRVCRLARLAKRDCALALAVWGVALVLRATWYCLLFGQQAIGLALADIVALY